MSTPIGPRCGTPKRKRRGKRAGWTPSVRRGDLRAAIEAGYRSIWKRYVIEGKT